MPEPKATPHGGQTCCVPERNRSIPLDTKTARALGGGSKGRTLAIIYRHLSYWSKYSKWKDEDGKRFFYKSAEELSKETSYSTKTIYRAIAALKELGLIVVKKLHSKYWRQVNFFYLPHSPFAAAAEASRTPAAPSQRPSSTSSRSTRGTSRATTTTSTSQTPAAGVLDASAAAAANASSIRARGGGGFGRRVPIQQKNDNPLKLQTLQAIVERCNAIAAGYIKSETEGGILCEI